MVKQERRTEKTRTIDKVLEKVGACDGTHCADHPISMYRLGLLEDAKDELCKLSSVLSKGQLKNNVILKVAGTIVTLCALAMLVVSGFGWRSMHLFTKDMYQLRENDLKAQEEYRKKQMDINNRQDKMIEILRQDLDRYHQ